MYAKKNSPDKSVPRAWGYDAQRHLFEDILPIGPSENAIKNLVKCPVTAHHGDTLPPVIIKYSNEWVLKIRPCQLVFLQILPILDKITFMSKVEMLKFWNRLKCNIKIYGKYVQVIGEIF